MLRHLTPFLVAALIYAPNATPAVAQRAAPPKTSDNLAFCAEFIQGVNGLALGECLSFLQTSDLGTPGFIPHLCTAFEKSDPEDFYLVYDSFADCVVSNQQ